MNPGSIPGCVIMKPFTCIESTLDITDESSGRTVRVWINRNVFPEPVDLEDALVVALYIQEQLGKNISNKDLVEKIINLFPLLQINAIQILKSVPGIKVGIVVYTVPFDDVHG